MFYVIVQVVLYIFCFRVDDFTNVEGGSDYVQLLRFTDIVACKLKPLKVCHSLMRALHGHLLQVFSWYVQMCQVNVVREFSRITEAYQLVYCAPYIKLTPCYL